MISSSARPRQSLLEEATPGNDPMRPFEHIAFTAPFNMSEQPAASICAGYDADSLPIGLHDRRPSIDDLGVLSMASARIQATRREKIRVPFGSAWRAGRRLKSSSIRYTV